MCARENGPPVLHEPRQSQARTNTKSMRTNHGPEPSLGRVWDFFVISLRLKVTYNIGQVSP